MPKPLIIATLLSLLAAPALAQPQPSPAPAPPAPLAIQLTVKAGSATRVYDVAMFDHACSKVEDRASAYEDEIEVCTRPAARGVAVEVQWHTRNGATEYKTTSSTIMRRGAQFEVGRAGGTRFALAIR